jgi:hypothetical protein
MACPTCKHSYVGQTSRNLNVRCQEHFIYIRNNDSDSVYGAHILNNIHQYGPISNNTSLIQQVKNGPSVKSFEPFYISLYSYNNKLSLEMCTAECNPIYQLMCDIKLCHSCAWILSIVVFPSIPYLSNVSTFVRYVSRIEDTMYFNGYSNCISALHIACILFIWIYFKWLFWKKRTNVLGKKQEHRT